MAGPIDVPGAWEELDVEGLRGVILVIGGVDSGKSTFVRYLWQRLASRRRLAVVDGDVGQAVLGPPTTQTLRMASPDDPEAFPPRGRWARWFVGSISPRGHMLPTVVGLCRLVAQAHAWGADTILVDTTGLISPEVGGVTLKWAKFDLLHPQVVVALRRGTELEPLIGPWRHSQRFRLVELPTSRLARERTREERRTWRQYRFELYFRRAGVVHFSLEQVPVLGRSMPVPGQLVGLIGKAGFLLALGVVRHVEGEEVSVLTPLTSPDRVDLICLGDLCLDKEMRDRALRIPR